MLLSELKPATYGTSSHAGSVLITGAAQGIGLAFTEALAQRATDLILVDRSEQMLERLLSQLSQDKGVRTRALAVDLSSRSAPRRVYEFCRRHRIRVSMLINNAGVGFRSPFARQPRRLVRQTIDVNVAAVVGLTRLFLPAMLRRRSGAIINVASIAAFQACPEWAVYSGSKAFIQSFTEALQAEVAGTGVYVASVCPGVTKTDFLKTAGLMPEEIPPTAQTPEQVVAEALRGMDIQRPLIVTGWSNRLKISAQRASLRGLAQVVRRSMRRMRLIA